MTFPVMAGQAKGYHPAGTVNHPITLPAGVQAGDLLVVFFSFNVGLGVPAVRAGSGPNWTVLRAGWAGNGAVTQSAVYTKVASGDNTLVAGNSIGVVSASGFISCRITGATGTAWAVNADSGNLITNPDPLALTIPSARDALWLVSRHPHGAAAWSASPAGYTGLYQQNTAVCYVDVVQKSLNAATENPGPWTQATAITSCMTVAIDPGAPVIPPSGATLTAWSGSAWSPKPTRVWNGSAWVDKPITRWDGSQWKAVT